MHVIIFYPHMLYFMTKYCLIMLDFMTNMYQIMLDFMTEHVTFA